MLTPEEVLTPVDHMQSCFNVSLISRSWRRKEGSLSPGTLSAGVKTSRRLFNSIRLKLCSRVKSPNGSSLLSLIISMLSMLMSMSSKVSMLPRPQSPSSGTVQMSCREVAIVIPIHWLGGDNQSDGRVGHCWRGDCCCCEARLVLCWSTEAPIKTDM